MKFSVRLDISGTSFVKDKKFFVTNDTNLRFGLIHKLSEVCQGFDCQCRGYGNDYEIDEISLRFEFFQNV